ncbi:transglycosylase SLT domain-containing protein [Methylobacter sp. sgz302048]|uniref:transglycosylase SLT domain-containing protein n=1 Tax=Methylobacter sp. sgz302048 TaxID=3455945 RepID=UPI003FA09154
MNKPAMRGRPASKKTTVPPQVKPRPRTTRPAVKKPASRPMMNHFRSRLSLIMLEVTSLVITVALLVIVLLGYSADRFSGTRFFSSLLPFAVGVVGLILAAAALLIGWWKLRTQLRAFSSLLPPMLAVGLALMVGWFAIQGEFSLAYGHFRSLVGGKQEAARITLAHQVYAAYRRYDTVQLLRLVKRAEEYNAVIEEAAKAFDLDPNLLQGVAAAESSFLPRDSQDGGHGLFQITRVPKAATEQAGRRLGVDKLSLLDHRHNAFIAAATLKHYLAEMKGDLFLGLLAYNIGPTNGGLRFIMQQYGVTDFVTIQPYLQQLPRDYPVRVLSYSLAFRLWQHEGQLPAYEEGRNAIRIQRIGIPGLQMEL